MVIMDPHLLPPPFYAIIVLLSYMQAPMVVSYYFGACIFSLCILQKAREIPKRRRISIFACMLTILVAYITEVLYYLSCSIADPEYTAPEFLAIRCLSSILIWSLLSYLLWSSKLLRWHAYFGSFVLQFALETATCLIMVSAQPQQVQQRYPPLLISCIRAFVSLLSLANSFVILVTKQVEPSTDEERQSLLGEQANSSPAANTIRRYSIVNQDDSSDAEDGPPKAYDDGVKAQQAKRLEQEDSWFGYLKGFMIFLPHLFPTNDWQIMACFAMRLTYMVQARVLNVLRPRQVGIITNELQKAYETKNGVMPWKDIGLWVLYTWINSSSGLASLDTIAGVILSKNASRRIDLLAYKHVLSLSMNFHTSKDSGEVLKAVEQASSLNSLIEIVLFSIGPLSLDLFVAMYYVTHLFDAYMAFIILFVGAAFTAIGIYTTTLSDSKRRDYSEKARMESSTVNETVRNWLTVASFNRLGFELETYSKNMADTMSAFYAYYFTYLSGSVAQGLLTTFGFAGTCVFGMTQIVTGRKPVGNLITFILYWNTITSPLYILSHSYRQVSSAFIGAERLLHLLNTKPSVADQEGAKDIVVHDGAVEFKDIEFHYDQRKSIINGISLKASGGQTIAFVGETGGGKSTIFNLLLRFGDVTKGSIMIDGQDIRSVTQASLRDTIGYVPQEHFLFNRTIRENLRYAKLDATDAEIEDACRGAAIHDDIVGFPDGYNSKVGERGVKLSGGQRQRISIARVLLKNPKIIMLDEATSAIDSSVEAYIRQTFRKLSQGRTTFVIAHRLSTIADADQILVVEKGEIIERGKHQELLQNKGGKYAELWRTQTVS